MEILFWFALTIINILIAAYREDSFKYNWSTFHYVLAVSSGVILLSKIIPYF